MSTDQPVIQPLQEAETSFACKVFSADAVRVTSGANLGDTLSEIEDNCEGDVYQLARDAAPLTLRLVQPAGTARRHVSSPIIAIGSDVGAAGERIGLSARLTLMAPDGDKLDLLVLRHEPTGQIFAMPLAPMLARNDYTLLRFEPNPTNVRLSDLACGSFASGTRITLANGTQSPVEALSPGDRILTRDHGSQPLRWIGRATLRGIGSFAPVVITKGTLGNFGDLIVSQQHRVFLYQRKRISGMLTSELLVQARHLVDSEAVFLREGGFVDYYSLVFDQHEIIYAEGIPTESLMVNETTLAQLPDALSAEVNRSFPGLSQKQHFGTEPDAALLSALGPQGLYKKGLAN